MIVKYENICGTNCIFSDVVACSMRFDDATYDFEDFGRTKNLFLLQIENERSYYSGNNRIMTAKPGDVLFLPHGTKYRSVVENKEKITDAIGIAFNLTTPDGEPVYFDEDIKCAAKGSYDEFYKRFAGVVHSVVNPTGNVFKMNSGLYGLMDELFSESNDRHRKFSDIAEAIRVIEKSPGENLSVKQLADMCLMSESSFLKKFKKFSGGVAPITYRNNVRFMLAEELAGSNLSLSEIAEKLGFYDASHLCRLYKKAKNKTLKAKYGK